MKYSELPKNNKICVRAWRGAHIVPDGHVLPCCFTSSAIHVKSMSQELTTRQVQDEINISKNNLTSIRNHNVWQQLRKDLINGVQNPICKSCWDLENSHGGSHRIQANFEHSETVHEIDYHADGTLDTDEISYWDIRDTNLCNMKCIMCSPGYSSLLCQETIEAHKENKINYFKPPYPDTRGNISAVIDIGDFGKNEIITHLKKNVDITKEIYFAGGEPLINQTHYDILDILLAANRTDCRLTYTSNLLKLNQFGKDVITEYWNKFDKIILRGSLDAVGARAEWARAGTKWDVIDRNVTRIMQAVNSGNNGIDMGLNVTLSMYTVAGLRQLIEWCETHQFNGNVTITNFLQFPNFYQITVLPLEYRRRLMHELDSFIVTLEPERKRRYTSSGKTNTATKWPDQWDLLRKIMESPEPDNVSELRARAKMYITSLDSMRNTSILKACPEFNEFWDTW